MPQQQLGSYQGSDDDDEMSSSLVEETGGGNRCMTSNYHMSVFFSKCCVHRKHQKENVPNIYWPTTLTLGAHGPSFPMPLWYGTGAGTYEKKQELPDEIFCCHGMSSGR